MHCVTFPDYLQHRYTGGNLNQSVIASNITNANVVSQSENVLGVSGK